MPINIPFLANVTDFIRGTRQGRESLDDVVDSLDELGRAGRDSGDDVARGLDTAADESEDASRRIEREFRDALDSVSRASRTAGDDVGSNVRRGADDASEGLDNMRDEADGTAREVAASFDGSVESIAGGFQELAANALAGFGPLGAAAGIALAAGIGVLSSAISEQAEKSEQRVSDMYDDMIESGNNFLSEQMVQQGIAAIFGRADDAAIKWGNLQKIVEATGVTEGIVARAYAGDAEARQALLDIVNEKIREGGVAAAEGSAAEVAEYQKVERELQRIRDGLEGIGAEHDDAASRAALYRDTVAGMAGVAVRSADEARAAFDGLGREIDRLPTTKTIRFDVDATDAVRWVDQWRPVVRGVLRAGIEQP